jgi:hypothetical protein
VERRNETAYALMKKFLQDAGLPGTDTRACRMFKLLIAAGFMHKERNYYHDASCGYAHGNFYVLHPAVRPGEDAEEEGEGEVSTVSLPGHFGAPDGDEVFRLELRVLECHRRFARRLRQLSEARNAVGTVRPSWQDFAREEDEHEPQRSQGAETAQEVEGAESAAGYTPGAAGAAPGPRRPPAVSPQ